MDINAMESAGSLTHDFPIAANQPFTTPMAYDSGVTDKQLGELVRRGLLRRPIKGVYLATEAGDSLDLRAASLALVAPRDSVVVDRHAGWLLGAEMVLAPGEHLDLRPLSLFMPAGRGRLRNALSSSGERTLRDDDVIQVGALQVTTPLRTAWDLGRVRWPDAAMAGVSSMHRLAGFDHSLFLDGVERFRGHRYVSTLRLVAPLAGGAFESPPEAVTYLRCQDYHIPVRPQVEVWDNGEFVGRLDLANEELMMAIEYDGDEWHSSPEQREHDRTRRERLRARGWLILVLTKEDLFTRTGNADAKIRAHYREALRRRGTRIAA